MRAHLSNAAYGVIDYAAYPVAMLLAAPSLLKHLGTAQYGVWIVATAVVSTGGIIAAGFGDANIQHVASARSQGNPDALLRAVRSMMGINLLLGATIALLCWTLTPVLARHVIASDAELQHACLSALRIAALLTLVRAVESVCISTQRAFERYGAAVRISIAARVLAIAAAIPLAIIGRGVAAIMLATAVLMVAGTLAQILRLQQYLGAASLLPAFDRAATAALFAFGVFSWLQAVSGVIFAQADRLVLGVSLGATAVTAYTLCVQMSQPIYGIAANGLHFLFPYLSARQASSHPSALRKTILTAFAINLLIVAVLTTAILLFGKPLLRAWVGASIAQSSVTVLVPIAWSFALLGLNVTCYYSMLAFGHVRTVTALNLGGGALMLLMMAWLLPRTGIHGAAMARLSYGIITLFMYVPLIRHLRGTAATLQPTSSIHPVCEEAS